MNWPFLSRQAPAPTPHVVVRHVVATKAENQKAAAKRTSMTLQLAVYVAVTPPDQIKAEADAFFARASTERMGEARGS
jgi:hypothetical protein